MDREQIIVTLTTWSARIKNIPTVLDTIFSQTVRPDKVVLNLAYDEQIPLDVDAYLSQHSVEVFRTEDTKVYKKLVPTLRRYPDACVISIDDDWLYPAGMIEDFMDIHAKYPNNPVSGNRMCYRGMSCHCGCASLTKAGFFGKYLEKFTLSLCELCPSDDIAYTYFELLSGYSYVWTTEEYFVNMKQYVSNDSYTEQINKSGDAIDATFRYLAGNFGKILLNNTLSSLVSDRQMAKELILVINDYVNEERLEQRVISERKIRSTKAYRIGKKILKPIKWLQRYFVK